MRAHTQNSDFFVVGGAMSSDKPSYVQRPADEEIFQLTQAGEFCYVLASRQMGKTSLIHRAAHRLRKQDISSVIIDLTGIGTKVTIDQWYLSLITEIEHQLSLSTDAETWWNENAALSPAKRLINFLRDVVLTEIKTPIVIFIDEIDTTLRHYFTDDFFAAIRSTYNERAKEPRFKRLTFVLLGVATPSDLIKDQARTPFNVGRGIDLREFSRTDAQVLEQGLERIYPEQGQAIFTRIFYWTNGHPYLTQKLCQATTESSDKTWTDAQVDTLIQDIFFSEGERREENLQFIHTNIIRSPQRAKLLALYRDIYKEKKVIEDERSPPQNDLKLLGLIRVENGYLKIRNEIYRQAFNMAWIKANTPVNRMRIFTIYFVISMMVITVLCITGSYFIYQKNQFATNEVLANAFITSYNTTTNPNVRLDNLANLFNVPGYSNQAVELFYGIALAERIDLFNQATQDLQPQIRTVIKGTYILLNGIDTNDARLLQAMLEALDKSDETSRVLAKEIENWLAGVNAFVDKDYTEALANYSSAIGSNDENPATYFERAQTYIAMEEHAHAVDDLSKVLATSQQLDLGDHWRERVRQIVEDTSQLHSLVRNHPDMAEFLPSPTITPIPPSPIPTNTPPPTATPTSTATNTPTSTFTPEPNPLGVFKDFESPSDWWPFDGPFDMFKLTTTQAYDSNYSGQLTYDFSREPIDLILFPPQLLEGQPNQVTAWVNGDGSGHLLLLFVKDSADESRRFTFGQINHIGWEKMTAYLDTSHTWPTTTVSEPGDDLLDYPISFEGLALYQVTDIDTSPITGTIYIDDLASVHDSPPPTPTPTPTATSTPIIIGDASIDFRADRTMTGSDECITLSWHVVNVRAVYLQGKPEIGERPAHQECPKVSTTYELRVILRNGKMITPQIPVTVIPKPTRTPTTTPIPTTTPTPTPTLTPVPTITLFYTRAPIPTNPPDGYPITRFASLSWKWTDGPLKENEYFDVRIYEKLDDYEKSLNPLITLAVRNKTSVNVNDNILKCNQLYYWSVRISEAENITQDGVIEGFIGARSPDSYPVKTFLWGENCD